MEEKIWFHMCMHDTGGHLISSGGLTEGKGGKGGGGKGVIRKYIKHSWNWAH